MKDRMDVHANVDVVSRQPRASDPLEAAIRTKLESLVRSPWAEEAMESLRLAQADFLSFAFKNFEDSEKVRRQHDQILPQLAQICRTKIKAGEDFLKDIPGSLILVTNHLGLPKLTRIDNHDHHLPVELDEIEPFLIRYAPLTLVADSLGAKIHEVSIELPEGLLQIQESCGVLTIPVSGLGRTGQLVRRVQDALATGEKQALVMYPEGGTSGKRNSGGPYDLDEFHSGSFVVAATSGLPILPVCQFFDSERGMELDIMSPVRLSGSDLSSVQGIARKVQGEMQDLLNKT
ncbi:hypothetical protein HY440_02530 [Candidatus Microgenomates bacterium]|nr:hypothetical protein [Candidatus Microgenomates bacterium]